MKKIFIAAFFVSGCGEASVDSIVGEYNFQGNVVETSTCRSSKPTSRFAFEIVSESKMTMSGPKYPFEGKVSDNAFEVSGSSPYADLQTIKFYSDDISSQEAAFVSFWNNNPFCYTMFEGTFERRIEE